MIEEDFAAALAKLIEAARDDGPEDEAIVNVLKDAQTALEEGQS